MMVVVMVAGAALRIFMHDWWIPLVWWNAFTFYVYLPAYICLLFGLVMHRWRLAAVAAAVVACHLVWVAPDFVPRGLLASAGGAEPAAVGDPSPSLLRLYYQNVRMHSDDTEWRIGQMLSVDPDVIALVEFAPAWEAAIRESRIPALYPHNTIQAETRIQDVVLFSKRPLEDVQYREIGPGNRAVAGTVRIDDTPVRLFCVHAPRPLPVQSEEFFAFGRSMIEWVNQTELPCVVMGDFNSTQHARWYQRLLHVADLHSAHRDVGRGYAVTWPNGREPLPPIRIDHLLVSPEFTCRSIREGNGGQSDHKPLICELFFAVDNDGETAVQ
jgi:endonuclease/exonuclease/phosphatase (EEP) superfamily protein YafD